MHQREQAVGVVLHFHIDVELDVQVFGLRQRDSSVSSGQQGVKTCLHEKGDGLGKSRYRLFGFFGGADVFHSIRTVPLSLSNLAWNNNVSVVEGRGSARGRS